MANNDPRRRPDPRRSDAAPPHRSVRAWWAAAVVAAAFYIAAPADAQVTGADVGHSTAGKAYREAVRGRGLQIDIDYLPADADLDLGEAGPDPEPRSDGAPLPSEVSLRWPIMIGLAVILVALGWIVVRHGSGTLVAMGTPLTDDSRRRNAATDRRSIPTVEPAPAADHGFLAGLRAMEDRAAALRVLTTRVLQDAAEANGLNVLRSQTARDILRILPRSWPHLEALRGIVQMEELVRFAGRPLSQFTLDACIEAARPMLGKRVPA